MDADKEDVPADFRKSGSGTLKTILALMGKTGTVLFATGIILSFTISLLEYGITLFLIYFLFALGFVNQSQLPSWFPFNALTTSPVAVWTGLFVIVIIRAVCQIITYQSKIVLTESVHANMRMILGYYLLKRDNAFTAMPLSRINYYMTEIFPKSVSYIFHLNQFISYCIQLVMVIVAMFFVASAEAFVGITGVCVMGYLVLGFNRLNNRFSYKVPEAQAHLERTKVRVVRNWVFIKVLRLQDREYQNYMNSVFLYYKNSVLAYFFGNLGGSLMPILGILLIAIIVLLNFSTFHTPAVNLVAFLYLFLQFLQRVSNGSNLIGSFFTSRPQFRDAIDFFNSLSRADLEKALEPGKSFSWLKGDIKADNFSCFDNKIKRQDAGQVVSKPPAIKVENLSFQWPDINEPVFEDISFDLREGGQLGIVGSNGSGKSTILSLILGILIPSQGKALVGGISGEEYVRKYYGSIGYVGTEPYLVHGTVRDNLVYGLLENVADPEIMAALKTVALDQFVAGLPGGLDYVIHENGEGLSSGQKQRLTIARIFLRKPTLLALDEPSANLDRESEMIIVDLLEKIKGKCTVIIVSHKTDMLKNADSIFDMGAI